MENFTKNEDLLNALKAGGEEAFSFIFLKYYSNLFSYAYRILNDSSDAQESVQKTFYHMWDIRHKLEIRDSIKSYLYRSVYNNCINIIRQKKLLLKYEEKGQIDLYFSRIIQSPQTEMRLIDSETRRAILQNVGSLPDRCKEIFIRCKINGQSYAEVAGIMDISIKTVENQMTIALKRLKEKLKYFILL
ncbi:MAG: RNA polymerase sigma-70 factor [Bacteroidales bacterium]|jgi:RNA polymerase sigma-70 factor (ECF subfamily)